MTLDSYFRRDSNCFRFIIYQKRHIQFHCYHSMYSVCDILHSVLYHIVNNIRYLYRYIISYFITHITTHLLILMFIVFVPVFTNMSVMGFDLPVLLLYQLLIVFQTFLKTVLHNLILQPMILLIEQWLYYIIQVPSWFS